MAAHSGDRWWLVHPDGTEIAIVPAGVVLGRDAQCDVVLADPAASRRHAIVYLSSDGPMVMPTGRRATLLDERAIEGPTALTAGGRLAVPGLVLAVASCPAEASSSLAWLLERDGGGLFGISRSPLAVGGGDDDDLRIDGLPARALRFRLAADALFVEPSVDARLGGELLEAGAVARLRPRDVIAIGPRRITVIAGGAARADTTLGIHEIALPTSVRLEFLPRGGRLTVAIGGQPTSLVLADRRCDLAASLLQPSAGHAPGEFVADDVLLRRVWPERDDVSRYDLNTLVYRLRKDLVAAGLDGCRLVERASTAGATRFAVADGASIVVC